MNKATLAKVKADAVYAALMERTRSELWGAKLAIEQLRDSGLKNFAGLMKKAREQLDEAEQFYLAASDGGA